MDDYTNPLTDEDMVKPFWTYAALTLNLHRAGLESEDSDAIRDEMDTPWYELSDVEAGILNYPIVMNAVCRALATIQAEKKRADYAEELLEEIAARSECGAKANCLTSFSNGDRVSRHLWCESCLAASYKIDDVENEREDDD